MEGAPKPQPNKVEKTKSFLSKTAKYGLAFLGMSSFSQAVQGQTVAEVKTKAKTEEGYQAKDSADYAHRVQMYNDSSDLHNYGLYKAKFPNNDAIEKDGSIVHLPKINNPEKLFDKPASRLRKANNEFPEPDYEVSINTKHAKPEFSIKTLENPALMKQVEPDQIIKTYLHNSDGTTTLQSTKVISGAVTDPNQHYQTVFSKPLQKIAPLEGQEFYKKELQEKESKRQEALTHITKPSLNFPWLNEIYTKNPAGVYEFDHYVDQETGMHAGTDYFKPLPREKK